MELKNSSLNASRVPWVDFLRSVGIYLVLVIHTACPLLHQWENISKTDRKMGNIYHSFARVSVPLIVHARRLSVVGKAGEHCDFL